MIDSKIGKFYVDPASNFGNSLVVDGCYETDMEETLRNLLLEGDVFVDLGANEGYFTILGARLVGEMGRVISIEPQSRLQSVLFANVAANEAHNTTIIQTAVSNSIGIAELSLIPDMNTGGSGLFRSTKYRVPTEFVPQTTLARLMSILSFQNVRLLKVDIEGFEYEAVLGSKELFSEGRIEHIALELHPEILKTRGKSGAEIIDFFTDVGYSVNPNTATFVMSRMH